MKKFFAVTCKCGHTGSRRFYIPITFAIRAFDGKEAANIARNIPRVKHHHKDCILSVDELNEDEYCQLLRKNDDDGYLHCSSIQDQNKLDISDRLIEDPHYFLMKKAKNKKEIQKHNTYFGKTKIKKPKKFIKNFDYKEELILTF